MYSATLCGACWSSVRRGGLALLLFALTLCPPTAPLAVAVADRSKRQQLLAVVGSGGEKWGMLFCLSF